MAGKKGHGGKKGRSGRKPRVIENLIAQVETLSMMNSVNYLDGNDSKQRFLMTKELAGKVLARRVKVGGDENGVPVRVIFRASPNLSEPEAR